MKKERTTIDGFVPRKSGTVLGGLHNVDKKHSKKDIKNANFKMSENKLLHNTGSDITNDLGQVNLGRGLGRTDINESLQNIDISSEKSRKTSRKELKLLKKQNKKPKKLWVRIVKWVILLIILGLLAFGGYFVYKFMNTGSNIFQGNIFEIFDNKPLQKDANGRSNFLILGTSEDDPGHDASDLTDSILVASVSQDKKDVFMFSIPRDLNVKYGMACLEGYSGKINSYFSCINDGSTSDLEQQRLTAMRELVGDVVGLDIQYAVHVNWLVLKDTVDAVGGIDVDVQGSNGDPGVLDRNADWRCNYTCYYINYDNGVHHMDGEHALYFAMARGHDIPTYGLSRSNFDREQNQQKVIIALKDKATSTGILTNLSAVMRIMDALGNNLRTNIQTNEIRTLVQVASEIKTGDIHSLNLIDGPDAVMSGNGNPKLGDFEYSDLQAFLKKNINSDPVVREAASIMVLNGTGQAGVGQTKANELTDAGFNVTSVDTAPDGTYEKVEIYQIGDGNTTTANKLSSIYSVTIKTTKPPVLVYGNTDFVIIFGSL